MDWLSSGNLSVKLNVKLMAGIKQFGEESEMLLQLNIIITDSNTHFSQNLHLISSDIMVLL